MPKGKLNDTQRQVILSELPALRRFCMSLVGQAADADDLLQATIERLLTKGMPGDAHPGKWVFRVCKNLWIDEIRFREVRVRMAHMVVDDPTSAASLEQVAGGELRVRSVMAAMTQLPEEQRMALSLVAIEGKSYAEAAEIMQIPVGTIMSRIARARKTLNVRFESDTDETDQ
jgi:RNA polymerase sigma factor (sigma-70 family)